MAQLLLRKKTMAIYHCSVRTFSRASGHSAVAAAAYRAGASLRCERSGRTHHYENRHGVHSAFILAPSSAPSKFHSRAILWNAAEASENRKNSRLAREVILALPHELSDAHREALARDMALYLIERYRVAVDVAIHSPVAGDGHDPRNHHAHLLFTTREITSEGFGVKTRILDDKKAGPQEIELLREVWEVLANDTLAKAGHSDVQIDRRTLDDQGIDRIPQTHIGPKGQEIAAQEAQDDEEEESGKGETGKKGSGGGSGQAPTGDNKNKDDEGDKSGDSGSGDPVALKLQSKRKTDDGRIINYPAIDKNKSRSAFVAEIKKLNAQRAAFGEKPLKEQIKDIDKLMERLDTRLAHMEELSGKTALPSRIMVALEKAVSTATKLIGLREVAKDSFKLSQSEQRVRVERQQGRYGKTYRRGLHSQIREMKTNIESLQTKQEQHARYSAFVEKLEKEIVRHTPSITPRKETFKSVSKTTRQESSLKVQLKASAARENLPLRYQQQVQVKRPASVDTPKLNEIAAKKFELPVKPQEPKSEARVETKTLQQRFTAKAEKPPSETKEPTYKTKNVVSFKALTEERKTHRVIKAETLTDSSAYKQPLKTEIKGLKVEAAKRGRNFVRTQKTINSERAAAKTEVKGKFNKPEDHGPKQVRTRDVLERLKETASKAREKIPLRYRATAHEEKVDKPARQSTKGSFTAAQGQASDTENPTAKMNAGFNNASNLNTKQPSEKRTSTQPKEEPDAELI